MPTILPLKPTAHAPEATGLDGLLGDDLLASELTAPALPGETRQERAARQAAAADILADLAPDPPHTVAISEPTGLEDAA